MRAAAGSRSSQQALAAAGVQADPAYRPDGLSLLPVLKQAENTFERPMYWRMKHGGQRALRCGDWKYLRVDGMDYLFNLARDARERANLAPKYPTQLNEMRAQWEHWNETMPGIAREAAVTLVYTAQHMPQR